MQRFGYAGRLEARRGIAAPIGINIHRRSQRALGLRAPIAVGREGAAGRAAVNITDNAAASLTCP